jgi:hypothetical protein
MVKLEIYKCGNEVTLKDEIYGIITSINIRFNHVQYEISYMIKGEYKISWFEECEFKTNYNKIKIGFKK